jgi:hypothetical protein
MTPTRSMLRSLAPCLALVRGSVSHPQYAAVGSALAGSLPHLETVVVPGQGHLATAFAPDALVDAVVASDAGAPGLGRSDAAG